MTFPTWNGEAVNESSPLTGEAIAGAWHVLNDLMGGPALTGRSVEELLHGAEAAAWLERITASARHVVIPLAKAKGASWSELGSAMGITRAAAQQRYRQEVATWEEAVRSAFRPA